LQYSGSTQDQSANLLGSFLYNSLADLEAGIPASFTRTLAARQRSTGQFTGSVSLGDSYRRTQTADPVRRAHRRKPLHYDACVQLRGRSRIRATQRSSADAADIQPRIGFSWTNGSANEIAAFFGQSRTPRAVVRGGIGFFTNASSAGAIGAALDNTGSAEWYAADRVRRAGGADRRLDSSTPRRSPTSPTAAPTAPRVRLREWKPKRDAVCTGIHAAARRCGRISRGTVPCSTRATRSTSKARNRSINTSSGRSI
jgi:hypothetical protein